MTAMFNLYYLFLYSLLQAISKSESCETEAEVKHRSRRFTYQDRGAVRGVKGPVLKSEFSKSNEENGTGKQFDYSSCIFLQESSISSRIAAISSRPWVNAGLV